MVCISSSNRLLFVRTLHCDQSIWGSPARHGYDQPRQCIKKQRHHFASKSPYSQSYGFSCSQVRMWELDYKEGWVPKSWCFWTVMLEKTLKSSLDCKETKPVNPKGNQSWILIGRTDAETEAPILWPPDGKSWFTGKDSDARKDWGQEKGVAEDEMDSITDSISLSKLQEIMKDSKAWHAAVHGVQRVGRDLVTEQQKFKQNKEHLHKKDQ